MRITWLLFLTVGCAGLMLGTGYAASSQQPSAGSSTNESSANVASDHPHDAEHASQENRPRRRASANAPSRPKQLPNSRKRSAPRVPRIFMNPVQRNPVVLQRAD
jgi:hypothetical protein